jgi:hypothetical protein
VYADRADFGPAHPDARTFRNAARLDAEIRERIDQRLFDGPHVRAHVALPLAQVQDGVADDLPRPMIGDVAAAVGGMEGDAGAGQDLFAGQEILNVTVAPHGDGVGVFQQEELVGDGASLALGHQPLLPIERGAVLHAAGFAPLALKH